MQAIIFLYSFYFSFIFYLVGNSTGFGSWILLGGSAALGTDATFIMNPFTGKYEAFMISPGGVIHRTWQHNENSFAGWRSMAREQLYIILQFLFYVTQVRRELLYMSEKKLLLFFSSTNWQLLSFPYILMTSK